MPVNITLRGGTLDYFHNCGLFWILEHINWEIANIHFEVLLKTWDLSRASYSDACELCHSLIIIILCLCWKRNFSSSFSTAIYRWIKYKVILIIMLKVLSLHELLEYKYGLVHNHVLYTPLITWAVLLGSMDEICICNDYKFNCFRLTRNNIM